MTGEFAIAVHALVFLNHKNIMLSSDVIAENVCTNPARIRKVMAMLKKAGFVETKEGLEGGYYIAKKPEEISLKHVGEAVDAEYVSSSWKPGNEDMDCLIASGMATIMDGIYGELNDLCRDYLEHITVADTEKKIFG